MTLSSDISFVEFPCAMCGEPVVPGESCECGFATCTYCGDGRGSGEFSAGCPHWVGHWIDEWGVTGGPIKEDEAPPSLAKGLPRYPTDEEIRSAFGDVEEIARKVYDGGFDERVGLNYLYELVCQELDGSEVYLVTDGMPAFAMSDYFVRDPERFACRLQELALRLGEGIRQLEAAVAHSDVSG